MPTATLEHTFRSIWRIHRTPEGWLATVLLHPWHVTMSGVFPTRGELLANLALCGFTPHPAGGGEFLDTAPPTTRWYRDVAV